MLSAHRGAAPVAHRSVAGSVLRQPRRVSFILFVDVDMAVLRALNRTNLYVALPRSMLILTRIPLSVLSVS
jgi:hypothetical protein